MLFALVLSIVQIAAGKLGWEVLKPAADFVAQLDFNHLLLQGMLGFLLFAGALHVEANELLAHKWMIAALPTIAVALALSFPDSPYRGVILVGIYIVVVFSIAVQGLTIKRMFGNWIAGEPRADPGSRDGTASFARTLKSRNQAKLSVIASSPRIVNCSII